MNLKHELENYTPWNEQEARDQAVLLHLLETQPDILAEKIKRHIFRHPHGC